MPNNSCCSVFINSSNDLIYNQVIDLSNPKIAYYETFTPIYFGDKKTITINLFMYFELNENNTVEFFNRDDLRYIKSLINIQSKVHIINNTIGTESTKYPRLISNIQIYLEDIIKNLLSIGIDQKKLSVCNNISNCKIIDRKIVDNLNKGILIQFNVLNDN